MKRWLIQTLCLLLFVSLAVGLAAEPVIVEVGDSATTTRFSELPLNFLYMNSLSETLYFADELGISSGTITAVSYKIRFTGDPLTKPVKLYMANVTEENLSTGWLPFAGFTLVYEGSVHFPTGVNEVMITLDTPFLYNGTNLAIRANRPMDSQFFAATKDFYYTATPTRPNRSRHARSHGVAYDPASPSGTSYLTDRVPNTKLWITPGSGQMILPSISLSGQHCVISWDAIPGASAYRVYANQDPYTPIWTLLEQTSANSIQIPLGSAARGFFRISALSD